MNPHLTQNAILFILINSGNIFNYLFQVMIGRKLTPEDYGAFNALNSMTVLITILTGVLPMVFAKFTVQLSLKSIDEVRGLFFAGMKWLCIGAGAVMLFGWATIPLVADFLRIHQTWAIALMVGQTALAFLLPLPMGILQGLQRFIPYGLISTANTGIRFASGVLYVLFLNWGITGALLSGATGMILSLAFGLYCLHDIMTGPHTAPTMDVISDMIRYSVPVLLMSIGVGSLGQIDIVLVRHFCSPDDAGFYATAAILGRIAFFLPSIFLMVMFPSAAKSHSLGVRNHAALWWSAGLTAVLAGGFAGICATWPAQIISLLYGKTYLPSAPLFRIISSAMAFLAMANVFFTYCLARNEYGFLWLLGIGLAIMLGGIGLFHQYSIQIAWALFISSALMCIGTIVWFLWKEGTT
ncbi:oligosaccharide flippase family protein [Desulfatirhabdium butyrativorans]|uniref:oligosaccharide flippase family protein n=1 Tax=Desulfatirhabdium butyrativorans TaxID=340467 RepID=UPI000400A2ED|nr:oligosaccharide flippase family protein [Desulfatirhabdium butyrativorans]